MPDIRQEVKDDRGLLKKIQSYIPGYKGYREREDLRIADSLLRNQLANEMDGVTESVKRSREELVKNMEMDLMNDAGELVNYLDALTNSLRHAQQGYSGISADVRIEQAELNRLYEWDFSLLSLIDGLKAKTAVLEDQVSKRSKDAKSSIRELKTDVNRFDELLKQRIDVIAGTAVR